MTNEAFMLERVCGNCQGSHPSEPFESDFAICLNDPEFEPYLDDILDRQDFSRCQNLVRRKRFAWDHAACERFDPVEDVPEAEISSELAAKLVQLARDGKLDKESLELAMLEDAVDRIDWAKRPIDNYLRELGDAEKSETRMEVVRRFGFLIGQGNRAAFDGLCRYLEALPPPVSVREKELRIEILRQLSFAHEPDSQRELARLLVDDLFRTPSNQTTRGWYAAVFKYFARSCPAETADEALSRVLDSPQFSYRIKRRVREVLGRKTGYGRLS